MELHYRIVERGNQQYIMPNVGAGFDDIQRRYIVDSLRDVGFFASVISPGRIAYTRITGTQDVSMGRLLGYQQQTKHR